MRWLTACCAAALALCLLAAAGAHAADLAIVGARIYRAPDAPTIEGGTLLVRDGKIAALGPAGVVRVPAGATVLDAHGGAVAAGGLDRHRDLFPPPPAGPPRHRPAGAPAGPPCTVPPR